jgi:hypothetical protein
MSSGSDDGPDPHGSHVVSRESSAPGRDPLPGSPVGAHTLPGISRPYGSGHGIDPQAVRARAIDLLQGGLERRRNWLVGLGIMGGFGAGLMVPSIEFGLAGTVATVTAIGLLRLMK